MLTFFMVPYPDTRIQKAFLKIKEDIAYLYTQILRDRQLILDIHAVLSTLSSKIDNLGEKVDSLLDNKDSTGNKGVNRRLSIDRPSTDYRSIGSQPSVENLEKGQKQPLEAPESQNLPIEKPLNLPQIRPERDHFNRHSTDIQPLGKVSKKQLLMYISIFRLQKELQRPITYLDLTQKTDLTESGVKYLIRTLTFSKAPLNLYRNPDNINCISIPEELQNDGFEKHLMQLLDSIHKRQKNI